MTQFKTTAAYLSGAVCGPIWWPVGELCGKPLNVNLEREFKRFSSPASFRDALLHILMEQGGDFQHAEFTADTVVRVERRYVESAGKYRVHVWEREVSQLMNCAGLVNAEAYASDFFGEE